MVNTLVETTDAPHDGYTIEDVPSLTEPAKDVMDIPAIRELIDEDSVIQFTAVIAKEPRRHLGLVVGWLRSENFLRVKEVMADGLVAEWNSVQDKEHRIRPGCRITSVNNERHPPSAAEEISKSLTLRLEVEKAAML
eukprot:CAMPEP_0178465156 /NCGR_PEP_ID=MMETSP0689_2-20121128/51212_1 /TAXON_ID=160604 /ORGANISM="Amphidinium massartii, Strain CS-259" /LENGTH=136 /DNA_ID=CAMNT_0020092079 /DNA_START=93 /DNA_END=503 /DNA_ORIENTATION=-